MVYGDTKSIGLPHAEMDANLVACMADFNIVNL